MDVVFLLDSSGSLGGQGFKQEKDFIQSFVSKLELGLNGSRVALVQFSTTAKLRMSFQDLQAQAAFKSVLDRLHFDAGDTNIHAALITATPLFDTKRFQVPQVVILVTDGVHNDRLSRGISPGVPAKKLKEKGVIIYAVGIGPEASTDKAKANFNEYTGSESNVFLAEFSDLQNVVNIIGAEVTATVNF